MKRTELRRRVSLQARNGIKPVTRSKQVRVPASWGKENRDACRVCGKWIMLMDPHHTIPAQVLRRELSFLPDDKLAQVLGDERNLMWLCRDCHERHHNRSRPVPAGCLNNGHWEFANLWDLDWYLEKMYPDNQEDET